MSMNQDTLWFTNNTEQIPSRGINRFWEDSWSVVTQAMRWHNLSPEAYERLLNERVKDQLQKINLVYRLVKTVLEKEYSDTAQEIFDTLLKDLWGHFEYILNEQEEKCRNIDFSLENEYEFRNSQISEIIDSIVRYFLTKAKYIENIWEILTEDLIAEVFSRQTADEVISDNSLSKTTSWSQNFQRWMYFDRPEKRDIEELDELCEEIFFSREWQKSGLNAWEIRRRLNTLKLAYGLAKWKFSWIERKTWGRYFEHLRGVAQIILDLHEGRTFRQVIIAILHDVVEDTNISIETIRVLFGEEIALSVYIVTKKSSLDFVDPINKKDEEAKRYLLENSKILNKNGLLKDYICSILRNTKWITIKSWKLNDNDINILVRKGLDIQKIQDIALFYSLESKYKKERNEEYGYRYRSQESTDTFALKANEELGFEIDSETLSICAEDSFVIKCGDIIHNLSNMWEKDSVEHYIKKTKQAIENILPQVVTRLPLNPDNPGLAMKVTEVIEDNLDKMGSFLIHTNDELIETGWEKAIRTKTREQANVIARMTQDFENTLLAVA